MTRPLRDALAKALEITIRLPQAQRVSTPSDDQRAALIADAAQRAIDYGRERAEPRVSPTAAGLAALDGLPSDLPEQPGDPFAVVRALDEIGSPATMRQTRGRYFGFVNGGLEPAAQAAAIVVGAWDQNTALPVMSPAATHLDAIAARWVVELLGFRSTAVATFCAGATVANFTGIVAARDALLARAGWNVAERGIQGSPALRIVTGAEAHVSVLKSLRLAGFGTDAIAFAPTDDFGRVDPARLPAVDERTIVVLQAGNVNTGHSDPFSEIIAGAQSNGAWVHVDGAFGLWAAVSPTRRASVAGVERADSWATDAHKWLNAPYDSGIAICARRDDLYRAMKIDAPYLATDASRPLMHLSMQMSQGARGVATWALLSARGRGGIAELVDRTSDLAARFAQRLASAGAQVLAPPIINQALVRFDDDETTDAVIAAVQADGTCWLGGTTWHGQRAMRISVCDQATTEDDVDESAAAVIRCWDQIRRKA